MTSSSPEVRPRPRKDRWSWPEYVSRWRCASAWEQDATLDLVELMDAEQTNWSGKVLSVATDRFERRLTEEVSALRVDLRKELHDGLAGVRQEMATLRVELFKWSFLFWIGQVAVLVFLLRDR